MGFEKMAARKKLAARMVNELGVFTDARRTIRCRLCGQRVFVHSLDVLQRACECEQEFNPRDFTFCPSGCLLTVDEKE